MAKEKMKWIKKEIIWDDIDDCDLEDGIAVINKVADEIVAEGYKRERIKFKFEQSYDDLEIFLIAYRPPTDDEKFKAMETRRKNLMTQMKKKEKDKDRVENDLCDIEKELGKINAKLNKGRP